MPILSNPRHEAFAQALAKRQNADEAYQIAGFKANRGNACRLKASEHIQERVAEIVGRSAEKAEATIERVLRELSRLGFADLRRAFDDNGRLKRPEEWDDTLAAAVASVEVVTRNIGDGEVEYVHKLRLWDKNSALEKIAKHLGMLTERVHVKHDATDAFVKLWQAISDEAVGEMGTGVAGEQAQPAPVRH